MAKVITLTMNPAIDLIVEMADFTVEAVNKARREQAICGGKGLNVSLVLSLLGVETMACGFLGVDNADAFLRFCEEHGIGHGFRRLPGATRTNVKLAVDGRGATDINLPGLAPSNESLAALESDLAGQVRPGDLVVLSGSLPPGVATDFYAGLIGRLRCAGAWVCLDASGSALAAGLSALPDMVKPNRDELLEVERKIKREASASDAVRLAAGKWIGRGIGRMAVSMGSDGALSMDKGACLVAGPAPVRAINAVGAGDTFVAGMVYGKLNHFDAERTLAFASALAGHWVEKMDRTILDRDRIAHLQERVTVSRYDRQEI